MGQATNQPSNQPSNQATKIQQEILGVNFDWNWIDKSQTNQKDACLLDFATTDKNLLNCGKTKSLLSQVNQ